MQGKNGKARNSEVKVYTATEDLYVYPDATAVCGEVRKSDQESNAIINPTLIVEVLSYKPASVRWTIVSQNINKLSVKFRQRLYIVPFLCLITSIINYTRMNRLFLVALLIPVTFLFSACSDDDEVSGPPRGDETIVQIVQGTEGLTVLNNILASDDFTSLRNQLGNGEYTLFAPNDAAFANLLSGLGITNLNLIDPALVSTILSYHIVPNQTLQLGRLDSSAVTLSQQPIRFSEGDSVTINASVSAQPTATIVSPEALYASNGVVHVISEVLVPPALQTAAPGFGTVTGLLDILDGTQLMNSIVGAAGLDEALADDTRSFTVIAPADGFLFDNNVNVTSENAIRFFATNHIIDGVIDVANPPRKVNSLAGIPLYLSVAQEDAIFVNGQGVLDVGAQVSNGQVLVNVGGVLNFPQDVAGALGSVQRATGQSFGIFQAALSQAGVTLSGEKTIFAPTDSAFVRAGIVASVDSATTRIDPTLLATILNNHVVEGVSFSTDLQSGTLTTVGEGEITLTITDGRATLGDANAENQDATFVFLDEYVYFGDITAVDAITDVGVVHAIDQLLLPE